MFMYNIYNKLSFSNYMFVTTFKLRKSFIKLFND